MDTLTVAASISATESIQRALAVISVLGLWAYENPYTGCVQNNSCFDYIIVGGGTAGAVLGNRLSEDRDVTVLVIEAGENYPLEVVYPATLLYTRSSRFDWNYTALPNEDYNRCHQDAFRPALPKVLGGGTCTDFMLYSQGFDRDFNEWAKITNESSWQFSNVQRLYKKLERLNDDEIKHSPDSVYHGFHGNLGLTKDRSAANEKYFKAFEQIGYKHVLDINNGTKLGYTGVTYYIDDGMRQNAAYAFLYPVRNRTNLVVLKNTQVVKIIIENINNEKRAVGVQAVAKNNQTFVINARKEVIVSAGNFNTVKLLQLSGIGPKNLLNKFNIPVIVDLPVGLNYQTHIATVLVFAVEKTDAEFVPEKANPHNFPAPTFEGYVSLNKSSPYPDYRSISFPVTVTPATILLQYTAFTYRFNDHIIDCWYKSSLDREVMFTLVENTYVESCGEVRIRSSSPYDEPIIVPGFYSNEIDVDNMLKYVKDFMRILESPYFKEVGAYFVDPAKKKCGQYSAYSDDYWRCYLQCLMAPIPDNAGTTGMGRVVDGRLRVYGVKGLRVVGSGIMPFLIPGSSSGPEMMIAENAAEMIREDNM